MKHEYFEVVGHTWGEPGRSDVATNKQKEEDKDTRGVRAEKSAVKVCEREQLSS